MLILLQFAGLFLSRKKIAIFPLRLLIDSTIVPLKEISPSYTYILIEVEVIIRQSKIKIKTYLKVSLAFSLPI